ncbi:MAG TPA: FAD:protein FMN transferase [Burkholderiaceae bacterium]
MNQRRWQRRAQPLLGTLVEVGWLASADPSTNWADLAATDAAFAAIAHIQASMSRFAPTSDISRFHALAVGGSVPVQPATAAVLAAAQRLHDASDGLFDISLSRAPQGWYCDGELLYKRDACTRLDLGGIAKGHAVDCAVQALAQHGCAAGWVNAGGDLRGFGDAAIPLLLRDEANGGVRAFGHLTDGAFATSYFAPGSRSQAANATAMQVQAHTSVAAPLCIWADALTKVVALSGNASHPLLRQFSAQAWLHSRASAADSPLCVSTDSVSCAHA